jgi:hypothetical protein
MDSEEAVSEAEPRPIREITITLPTVAPKEGFNPSHVAIHLSRTEAMTLGQVTMALEDMGVSNQVFARKRMSPALVLRYIIRQLQKSLEKTEDAPSPEDSEGAKTET